MPFLPSTKECSKVEIVLVLVPALSYQAYFGKTKRHALKANTCSHIVVSAFGRNDFVAPAALHVFSNFSIKFYWFDTCRRHPSFSKKNPLSASGFFAGRRGWGVVFPARAFRSEKHKVRHALKKVSPLSELHIHVAQMWTKLRCGQSSDDQLWNNLLSDPASFSVTLHSFVSHSRNILGTL